jgi:hypothetical protein
MMSDAIIFTVGIGVFAITTTATLLYGYGVFLRQAQDQGIGEETAIEPPSEDDPKPLPTPVDSAKVSPPTDPSKPPNIQPTR